MNIDFLKNWFYSTMKKEGRIKENFSSDDLFNFMEERKISFNLNEEEKKEDHYNIKPIHNILE